MKQTQVRERYWYPAIEGLRGIAAGWVLLSHVLLLVQCSIPLLGRGDLAVDLFILISGFLMMSHYIERQQKEPWESPETWKLFWLRRFFRIAPLYYLLLGAALLAGPALGEARNSIAQFWPGAATPLFRYNDHSILNILSHISFIFGLSPYFSFSTPLPDWSIGLEVQYYAVFPFILWLAVKIGFLPALLVVGLSMIFFAHAAYFDAFIMPAALPLKFLLFASGMMVAWSRYRQSRWFAIAAILTPVLAYAALDGGSRFALVIQCLLVLLLYVCSLSEISGKHLHNKIKYAIPLVLSSPLCQWFGRVSYSVYLLHLLIVIPTVAALLKVPSFSQQTPPVRTLVVLLIVVPIIYGVSYGLYRFVELGGIRLGKKVIAGFICRKNRATAPTILFESWLKTIVTTAGLMLVTFVTSVVSARLLGPEGRGILSSAQLVVSLSSGIGQLGLGTAFVYACRVDTSFPGRRYFFISVLSTTILATVLAGLALDHGATIQQQLFLPLLVLTGVTTANAFASAVTQLSPGLSAFNTGRFGLAVMTLLVLLVLVDLERLTVANILWTQMGATAIATLFLGFIGLKLIRSQTGMVIGTGRVTSVGYLLSGLKFHGTALLSLLLLNIDKLTLYTIGSAKEFGLYSVAYATSRLIGSVQEAMSTALYARFAGKDPAKLTEVVQLSFRFSFLPLLFVALLLGYFSPWILQLVYGHAFTEVALPFAILLAECVIGNASWILAQQFNATGRPGMVLIRQVVAVCPALLLIFWIPRDYIALSLSLIMLLSAFTRLAVTMLMFKWVSNLSFPRFFPTKADFVMVRENVAQLRASRVN